MLFRLGGVSDEARPGHRTAENEAAVEKEDRERERGSDVWHMSFPVSGALLAEALAAEAAPSFPREFLPRPGFHPPLLCRTGSVERHPRVLEGERDPSSLKPPVENFCLPGLLKQETARESREHRA